MLEFMGDHPRGPDRDLDSAPPAAPGESSATPGPRQIRRPGKSRQSARLGKNLVKTGHRKLAGRDAPAAWQNPDRSVSPGNQPAREPKRRLPLAGDLRMGDKKDGAALHDPTRDELDVRRQLPRPPACALSPVPRLTCSPAAVREAVDHQFCSDLQPHRAVHQGK